MATWSKVFSFFRWKNRPDTSTPLGQTLLNRINEALNEIDNRVITLNSQKASTDEIQGVFTDVRLIKNTGQFVFTLFDGTEKIIDTALEKISINVSFDQATQMMVLEKDDGSKEYLDLSVFTTQYEFVSSPTIQQTVTDGKVRADIKPNSITDQMLQTNYLSDITTQANTAVSASQSALESQSLAEQSAEDADRHADRAEAAADRAEAITGFTVDTNLDKNSSNPIANKAVAEALENVDAKTLDGHGAEYFAKGADLANYLPLNGTGFVRSIKFKEVDNGYGTVTKNHSETVDYGTAIIDNTVDGKQVTLRVMAKYNRMDFIDNSNTPQTVLHTGNKPSGTYTGNGDATSRTVSIGGAGSALLIFGGGYSMIAMPFGSIGLQYSGGNTIVVAQSECKYLNGTLNLATANYGLNANGTTYTYQVL